MNTKNQVKISFVDDHALLRDSLAKLVQGYDEFDVIDCASHGEELLEHIQDGRVPDIIVMDLNMPVMDGYTLTEKIYEQYNQIKILILTMFDSEVPLIRLLNYNVRGYVKKDVSPDDFVKALQNVVNDGYYYSHNHAARMSEMIRKTFQKKLYFERSLLNPLEIEFLKYCATEYTYKEVAEFLDISIRHTDNIRNNLFNKLCVRNRVGLAIYAVKNGLVFI